MCIFKKPKMYLWKDPVYKPEFQSGRDLTLIMLVVVLNSYDRSFRKYMSVGVHLLSVTMYNEQILP